jgi:hypothetical protein
MSQRLNQRFFRGQLCRVGLPGQDCRADYATASRAYKPHQICQGAALADEIVDDKIPLPRNHGPIEERLIRQPSMTELVSRRTAVALTRERIATDVA